MKVAMAGRKGGVGKTSITATMASLLAVDGRRVLAIDLDPQSNLAFVLGGDVDAPGTAELMVGQSVEPLELAENLFVLPGGPLLTSPDISRLHPEDLADIVAKLPYDDILFDGPPGHDYLERFGIVASDAVLVVMNAHPSAKLGAGRILHDLNHLRERGRRGPARWAVVTNAIDARRRLDRKYNITDPNSDPPCFRIRQDTQLALATAQGIPLAEFDPKSIMLADVRALAGWCNG